MEDLSFNEAKSRGRLTDRFGVARIFRICRLPVQERPGATDKMEIGQYRTLHEVSCIEPINLASLCSFLAVKNTDVQDPAVILLIGCLRKGSTQPTCRGRVHDV